MKKLILACLVSSFLLQVHSLRAFKKVPLLAYEEVATTWIGFSEGEARAYRIELRSDGSGLLALTRGRTEPLTIPITSWEYNGGKIQIVGPPNGGQKYPLLLKGRVIGNRMSLVDKGDNWKFKIEMRRESSLIDLLDSLRVAMAEFEAEE